jgi:hypothetical protein
MIANTFIKRPVTAIVVSLVLIISETALTILLSTNTHYATVSWYFGFIYRADAHG